MNIKSKLNKKIIYNKNIISDTTKDDDRYKILKKMSKIKRRTNEFIILKILINLEGEILFFEIIDERERIKIE